MLPETAPATPPAAATAASVPRCRNCAAALDPADAYCRHCGQRQAWQRLTVKGTLGNAVAQVFNFDRGLGHNLKLLFTAPGQLVRDLISGRTQPYLNAFRMVLVVTAVVTFIQLTSGAYEFQQNQLSEALYDPEMIARQRRIQRYLQQYLSVVFLVLIPFLATANYWLTRRRGLNFAEHLVLATVQTTGAMLVTTPLQLLLYYTDLVDINTSLLMICCSILYYAYAIRDTFGLSLGATAWRALLSYVITFVLFLTFVVVLTLVSMIGYGTLFGKEALQAIFG